MEACAFEERSSRRYYRFEDAEDSTAGNESEEEAKARRRAAGVRTGRLYTKRLSCEDGCHISGRAYDIEFTGEGMRTRLLNSHDE
jgi:hypothetical protein